MSEAPFPTWKKNDIVVNVLHSIAGLATQILVYNNKDSHSFLIDCGDGSTRDIVELGIDYHKLTGIAITHGHYDHCSGLHSLLGFFRMIGRQTPLIIIYPKGCFEVDGILNNFEQCYLNSLPFKIIRNKIDTEIDTLEIDNSIKIKTVRVLHYGSTLSYGIGEQIPALGYEIKINDTKIAYSGDTGPTKILKKIFTPETDLGLIEATHPDDTWIKDHQNRYHLTEREAKEYSSVCRDQIIIHKLHKSVRDKY